MRRDGMRRLFRTELKSPRLFPACGRASVARGNVEALMKFFSLFAMAAAVGLSLAGQPARAAADATGNNFQIDAAHDGAIRFKRDFHAPLKRKWIRDLGSTVSYPVSGDGKVFVTATGGAHGPVLYALSQTKGTTLWQKNLSGTGGTPVYHNCPLVGVSNGGSL